MTFEELGLRPTVGEVDTQAVERWLRDQVFVYENPASDGSWYMFSSAAELAASIGFTSLEKIAPVHAIVVEVCTDAVYLSQRTPRGAERHALQFVQWLTRSGTWTAALDAGQVKPLDDPNSLFPEVVDE